MSDGPASDTIAVITSLGVVPVALLHLPARRIGIGLDEISDLGEVIGDLNESAGTGKWDVDFGCCVQERIGRLAIGCGCTAAEACSITSAGATVSFTTQSPPVLLDVSFQVSSISEPVVSSSFSPKTWI